MKKKILSILMSLFLLTSCDLIGVNGTGTGGTCSGSGCTTGDVDLDKINTFFSDDSSLENLRVYGNVVALIPFTHINGPKLEWDFFAIVNFVYNNRRLDYTKYQVTYLSCTCRDASVNYWQTMYVELTKPVSHNIDDVRARKISFEKDDTGLYLAGFWGDSGIKDFEPTGIEGSGIFYEDIRDCFIPYLTSRTYGQLKDASVTKTMTRTSDGVTFQGLNESDFLSFTTEKSLLFHENLPATLDNFAGASVSTDNLLRCLQALIRYHAAKYL